MMISDLREMLNSWDPIGILDSVPNPPDDEYDRLLVPVADLLEKPYAREQLTRYLRDQMVNNFGLDPELVGVEGFVDKLIDKQS